MRYADLRTYRCPSCKSVPLELHSQAHGSAGDPVIEGSLSCPKCESLYTVKNGLPRFVSSDQYAESFGFQWNKFGRTQLDSHTRMPLSGNRLFHVTAWPKNMEGLLVLEAGSGAGRFTEVLLKTGATVFSFDLSSAVEANMQNNGTSPKLSLFQASIFDVPLPELAFDKVICLGVLQHTPDPSRAFQCLARHVKPGGEIAVDVYARRWLALISWKYILRPITTRVPRQRLFQWVERSVDFFLPLSIFMRKLGGRVGARLLPILEYSHWGLPYALNREWAILDTFDMYSPAHDHPGTIADVRQWFATAGFVDVIIEYGPNGVIGRGRRPTVPLASYAQAGHLAPQVAPTETP